MKRYIGCFVFDDFGGEPEHAGSFQILADATSPERAIEIFQRRMRRLKADSTLFSEPTTVYINGLIELGGSFEDGLLVNYSSGPRAENDWQLGCLIPEQKDHQTLGFEWTPTKKKNEKDSSDTFLDLGAERFLRERERESKLAERTRTEAATTTSTLPSRADLEAKRTAERARAAAEKQRRNALDATLAEIGKPKPR